MIKVGIRLNELTTFEKKEVAQHLQRFIVEGDYSLKTIIHQLQEKEMIVLDVSNEENMPELTSVLDSFDEELIAYQLYKEDKNEWKECTVDDFDLNRNPIWTMIIGITLLGYFVISFFEIFAIYDWFTLRYELGGILSAGLATITAYVPLVGSVFAYFGATELWHWNSWLTIGLYFWYYLLPLGFIVYLLWIIVWGLYLQEKWYDFWNPEFK